MLHTVFSTDNSPYLRWQADLLAFTHSQVGQSGPLTRLWSSVGQPSPFAGQTFVAAPYNPHPITGEFYPPYNRTSALSAWLRDAPPDETTILHLEPDFIFTSPIDAEVERGRPIAHPHFYMEPALQPEVIRRHCAHPQRVQPIGIPKLIHRDDLAEVAPLWLARTEDIRQDPVSREAVGWVSDMWAYVCVTADLDLHHTVLSFGHYCTADQTYPLIHYCYGMTAPDSDWHWDKRTYLPWTHVTPPPTTVAYATRVLIRELNACAAAQGHIL